MRLVVLDGGSGAARFAYTFPFGTEVASWGTKRQTPRIAPPVIGPDGTVFAPVAAQNYNTITGSYGNQLSLVRLQPDGSVTVSAFKTITTDSAVQVSPSAIIPDGEGGAFISWYVYDPWSGYQAHLTHATAGGAVDRVIGGDVEQMVLGENGVIFVSDRATVTACRADTLATLWSYPRSSTGHLDLVVATADGGVIVSDGALGLIALAANGTPGSPYSETVGNLSYDPQVSWVDNDWVGIVDASTSPLASRRQPLSADQAIGARAGYGRRRRPSSSLAPVGATTGTPAFAMFTWLAAYPALAVWIYPEGNAEGQNIATAVTTMKLVWCGTGYGTDGTEGVCGGGGLGIVFGYADDPSPTHPLVDFSATHRDWVDLVQNTAQRAYADAFPYRSVYTIPRGSTKVADHTVAVTGRFRSDQAPGETPLGQHAVSFIYYPHVLYNAELALDPGGGSARFVPVSHVDYRRLLAALGRGIGNTAAHETGHQLSLPGMDCGNREAPDKIPCEGGSNRVYNFFSGPGKSPDPTDPIWSGGAQFFYLPDVALGWTPSAACFFVRLGGGKCP
jgi:hypothetical protein